MEELLQTAENVIEAQIAEGSYDIIPIGTSKFEQQVFRRGWCIQPIVNDEANICSGRCPVNACQRTGWGHIEMKIDCAPQCGLQHAGSRVFYGAACTAWIIKVFTVFQGIGQHLESDAVFFKPFYRYGRSWRIGRCDKGVFKGQHSICTDVSGARGLNIEKTNGRRNRNIRDVQRGRAGQGNILQEEFCCHGPLGYAIARFKAKVGNGPVVGG